MLEYLIIIAGLADKPLIDSMLQDYLRELSLYEPISVSESGRYDYPYLDLYWSEAGRYPYLLYLNNKVVGFALVRKDVNYYEIAEYSILSDFRRQGLGTVFASAIINKHTGKWHIEYNLPNIGGKRFWNKLVFKLAGQNYTKHPSPGNREYLEFVV